MNYIYFAHGGKRGTYGVCMHIAQATWYKENGRIMAFSWVGWRISYGRGRTPIILKLKGGNIASGLPDQGLAMVLIAGTLCHRAPLECSCIRKMPSPAYCLQSCP